MGEDMIFWDDMWNKSSSDEESTEAPEACCGNWDEFGRCCCNINKSNC